MLVDKGTGGFSVALGADRIHLCRRAKIFLFECAVRIVAVCALHQAFFHLVMERHVELRLGIGVALEAEFRLSNPEKLFLVFAAMDAVAAYATHIVLAVRRAFEIRMLALVAAQASCIDFLRRSFCRIEDFGDVAATVNVRFACSVATLASDAGLAVHLCELGVLVRTESFAHFLVAGGADFLADEISGRRCGLTSFGACGFRVLCGSSEGAGSERNYRQQKQERYAPQRSFY
jgi:hypothetical protein